MNTTTESELYVIFSEACPSQPAVELFGGTPASILPAQWRIGLDYDGQCFVTDVGFPRMKDAEMAVAALSRASVTDGETMMRIVPRERQRIMLEALQW